MRCGGGGGGWGWGVFFFKQKTAYEMCGRDWSSDVCSSDLMVTPALLPTTSAFNTEAMNFISGTAGNLRGFVRM